MTAKYFVDTNIFIYCRDRSDAKKRQQALNLIKTLWQRGLGVISCQVLTELCAVYARKFDVADQIIEREIAGLKTWDPLPIDADIIDTGLLLRHQYHISHWDSWIVAAALHAKCAVILSEDLSAGAAYHGVKIINPFEQKVVIE
jgi:predicted nucleic acid-binding protein